MSNTEKITIIKIKRQDMPSKYKEGDTYKLTTILDSKKRKMTATGKWAENWKVDDVIEAIIEKKPWTDRNGNEIINLNLKNPNPKTFQSRGYGQKSIVSEAATIAIQLFPLLNPKAKITIDSFFELVEEIKIKFDELQKNESSGKSSKSVNVDAENWDEENEEKKKDNDDDDFDEEDDEDLPF